MENPLDKFWQMTQRNAAKRPAPPDPNTPQPPAPVQSMANAINEPLRIAHNLEGKIKSIKDRIDALQLQMDQLKSAQSAKEDWKNIGAEFEKFADALEDSKKDLQEMAQEIPSAADPAYDQNAADLAASIGKSLTEINNLEARVGNLDDQVVVLEKKTPSRTTSLAPGATARAGASSAPVGPRAKASSKTPEPSKMMKIQITYSDTPAKKNPLAPITAEQQAEFIREFSAKEAEAGLWNILSFIQAELEKGAAPTQVASASPQEPTAPASISGVTSAQNQALENITSEIRETLLQGNPNAIVMLYDRIERTQQNQP